MFTARANNEDPKANGRHRNHFISLLTSYRLVLHTLSILILIDMITRIAGPGAGMLVITTQKTNGFFIFIYRRTQHIRIWHAPAHTDIPGLLATQIVSRTSVPVASGVRRLFKSFVDVVNTFQQVFGEGNHATEPPHWLKAKGRLNAAHIATFAARADRT